MIRILVDSLADAALTNAQMVNAREIVSRLDPARFHVSMFHLTEPDPRIAGRPATRLIKLPARRQTFVILEEFVRGEQGPAIGEVRAVHRLDQLALLVFGLGQMQETVRRERVSGALALEVVLKAVLGGAGFHLTLHLPGTFLGKAVLAGQVRRGFDGVVMWSTRI